MLNVSRAVLRSFTTAAPRRSAQKGEIEKGYFELKKIQEHFQKNDGKPVFLKGSVMDKVLYRLTMGLTLLGLIGCGKFYYELGCPQPPSE